MWEMRFGTEKLKWTEVSWVIRDKIKMKLVFPFGEIWLLAAVQLILQQWNNRKNQMTKAGVEVGNKIAYKQAGSY